MVIRRTPLEVAQILENFLENKGQAWDWDDFTSHPIGDPALDAIRMRCDGLSLEFPAQERGQYCGPDGAEVIRSFIIQLRQSAV